MKLKKEKAAKAESDKENETEGSGDILGEQEDADVIFWSMGLVYIVHRVRIAKRACVVLAVNVWSHS